MNNKTHLFVDNYGEMLAQVNDMELISFKEDGGYQGDYVAVLLDKDRLFYFMDSYGSCSSCDWLEDKGSKATFETDNEKGKKRYAVLYKDALEFCGELKPKYIVPKSKPLEVVNNGKYSGFNIF